jgi:hypothetical protein
LKKAIGNLKVMERSVRSSNRRSADELEKEQGELGVRTKKKLIEVRELLLKAKTRLERASRAAPRS